jgi:hypothetical protein
MTFSSSAALRFLAGTAAIIAFATPAQAQATHDFRFVAEWQTTASPYTQDLPDAGLRPTIRISVDANKNLLLVFANYPAIPLTKQSDGTFRGRYPGGQPVIVNWDSNYGLLLVDLFNQQWTRNYFSKNGIGSSVALGLELAKAAVVTSGRVVASGSTNRTFLDLTDGTSVEFTPQDYTNVINQVIQDPTLPDFPYTSATTRPNPFTDSALASLWDALVHRQITFGEPHTAGVLILLSGQRYLITWDQYNALKAAAAADPSVQLFPLGVGETLPNPSNPYPDYNTLPAIYYPQPLPTPPIGAQPPPPPPSH